MNADKQKPKEVWVYLRPSAFIPANKKLLEPLSRRRRTLYKTVLLPVEAL
jgi:hypothetical protein